MSATDLDAVCRAIRFARAMDIIATVPGGIARLVNDATSGDVPRNDETPRGLVYARAHEARGIATRAANKARLSLGTEIDAVRRVIETLGGIDAIEARAAIIEDGGADIVPFPPGGDDGDGGVPG